MPLDRAAPPGSRSGARAATGARLHWCGGRLAAAAPGLMRDGTGSGSWSCRRGCTRVAGGRVGRVAAMTCRDAAPPQTGRRRPRTRPRAQVAPPACRPARSAFFGRGIGIADAHRASVFALAHHHAGFAPGAALLPAQAALVQGAPDRERADLGQPVWSLAQGFLQQAQGPGGRAVLLALGRAGPFGQDALLRVSAIVDPWSAPMAGPHGGEPLAVEAADPGRDGLGVPSSDLVSGSRVARAISNGQQRSGALDLRGGGAERAAQAGQLLALIRSKRAKGIFLGARHGAARGTSGHEDRLATIPDPTAVDPLVFEAGGETTLADCFTRGEHLLSDVELTEQRARSPVAMGREAGHPEPWIIALSQPPSVHRAFDYGLRWGIEALFSDFKTRGFNLEDSQITRTDRLDRLVLVLSLALHWAVSTGMWDAVANRTPAEKRLRGRNAGTLPAA